jgi:hypothetical protein
MTSGSFAGSYVEMIRLLDQTCHNFRTLSVRNPRNSVTKNPLFPRNILTPVPRNNVARYILAKHASFSGSLCTRSVPALHLKRLFDNAGLPTTKPRDSALRAVTTEVVGSRVLVTRSPFGGDILCRLLPRVSPMKLTSADLQFR